MVAGKKNKAQAAKNGNKPKRSRAPRNRSRPRPQPRALGVLGDPRAAAWERLLRDPCAASLAPPCYGGADSGYLVRVVDNIKLPITGTGFTIGPGVFDQYIAYTPYNISSTTGYHFAVSTASGAALSVISRVGSSNFIGSGASGAVKRFRPVAACLKWVPSGPYGTRQGVVGMSYSPGIETVVGQSLNMDNVLSASMNIEPNGSTAHEVRWLPTSVDENFTDTLVGDSAAAGTVHLALRGIDGVYTSATAAVVNGYIEATTVYEWVPQLATGLSNAPVAPLPFTTQQVLSTIGDMGKFLFEGVRAVGAGNIRSAAYVAANYLSGGMQGHTRRGNAVLY